MNSTSLKPIIAIAAFLVSAIPSAHGQTASGFVMQPNKTYVTRCGAVQADGTFSCKISEDSQPAATEKTAKPAETGAKVAAASPAAASVPAKADAADAAAPAAVASAAPASAAETGFTAKNAFEALSDFQQADLSIPVSPAAGLLGISADKVQHPGTIRELASTVVHGIGLDGKPLSAVALDVAPVFMLWPSLISAGEDYAPEGAKGDFDGTLVQHLRRVAARTTLSFGATNPDSNGASQSAAGIRIGLLDSGDPGLYWSKALECVTSIKVPLPAPPGPPGNELPQVAVDYSKCDPGKDTAIALWARPSLYVGYGQSWFAKNGSVTDQAPNVKQFWLSGSWGYAQTTRESASRDLRVLGQAYLGRRLDDRTPDPSNANQLLKEDTTDVIGRLTAGKSNWHGFLELGRSRVRLGDSTTENLRHTAIGAEYQVGWFGTDSWFEIASVNDRGYIDGKTHSGVQLNFRLGTPALTLPGAASATSQSTAGKQ